MMRKKGSLILLKLCSLKVHVKLIFLNFENCDVTIFNYEKNRFLCRNFGNFGSKPQAMRGLFWEFLVQKHRREEAFFHEFQLENTGEERPIFYELVGFSEISLKGFLL